MVLTSHHSVLFLRLEYPQLQLPGTESFPSSTKACPIYLRSVSGIFPLCIPTLLLLLDFDYPRQNHFNSFLTGFLVSPHPQHRPTNVTPLTKPTKHSLYPLHVNLWSSPRQLEYSLNYFHSWETAYLSNLPSVCSTPVFQLYRARPIAVLRIHLGFLMPLFILLTLFPYPGFLFIPIFTC